MTQVKGDDRLSPMYAVITKGYCTGLLSAPGKVHAVFPTLVPYVTVEHRAGLGISKNRAVLMLNKGHFDILPFQLLTNCQYYVIIIRQYTSHYNNSLF